MNSSKLVYSTDGDNQCPVCAKALHKCRCSEQAQEPEKNTDGIVRIQRESKGRGGKQVTLVSGLDSQTTDLKKLAKAMKAHAGSGGSIKNGIVEIQGDKRDVLKSFLEGKGFSVKTSGG